ncbi:MAG: anthranilate synthase component I family protein [Bacteroidota bacterium]|nr:anthranilate synthase component I family protein [Bacteroidota bacterium]
MKVKTKFLKVISDIHTPVGVYLKLRDLYSKIFLLESSDYKGSENSLSFICFESKAQISIDNNTVNTIINAKEVKKEIEPNKDVSHYLNDFINQFEVEQNDFDYPSNGLFGYISYDSVKYFDSISISNPKEINIPDILYDAFKYVIVFNHYNNELIIFEHLYGDDNKSEIDKIKNIVLGKPVNPFSFKKSKEEQTNVSDKEFKKLVDRGINHCKLGDVFQIVLSKRFYQDFQGDEFQVYRALRSINPSPYLFYFDYGSFKIFGSSPEAQIVIKNNKATIYPIAGTFKRTGDDEFDKKEAEKLSNDIKENSEHVMLVDLARNDLSKVSKNVEVERFKDIQFYSHVIHLVSKVSGNIKSDKKIDLISGTFPAGTLSGAPKHKAMQLIEEHENISREFYGGAIGFMGFNGDFNHAIIIRSFLSKNRRLFYQAGAGIVFKSNPDSENQEVYNKIEALRKAIKIAEKI